MINQRAYLRDTLRDNYGLRLNVADVRVALQSEDWDAILLLAQCVNALAKKTGDAWWYSQKEYLLSLALEGGAPSLRYRDGVMYAETTEGQVSFHVFDDLADRAYAALGEEAGEIWVQDLAQTDAPPEYPDSPKGLSLGT